MSCVGVVAGVDRAQDVRAASALKIGVFDRHTRSPWTSRRTIRFFALLGTPHLDRRRTAGTLRTGLIGQRRARHAGIVTFVVTFLVCRHSYGWFNRDGSDLLIANFFPCVRSTM